MHRDTIRPDGQWPPETVVTPGDARALDVAQASAINEVGGTWNPPTPVCLGGAGLALTGGLHQLAGGLSTAKGGRMVLGHSDYPTFTTPATRTILVPLHDYELFLLFSRSPPQLPFFSRSPTGTIFSSPVPSSALGVLFPIPKRFLHNGATLTSATLNLAIGQPHASVPATQPKVQLIRNDWFLGPVCTPFIASGIYAIPELTLPTAPNGKFYCVTAVTGAASAEPTWPTTPGATVSSGGVTWTCGGSTWSGSPTIADPPLWQASTPYARGVLVQPNPATGQWFECTATGTSGSVQPSWPSALETFTPDGSTTWLAHGAMLPILSGAMSAGSVSAYYAGGAPQPLALSAVTGGPSVIDTTKYSYALFVQDESGSGALSPSLNRFITAQLSYTAIADMRPE